MRIEGRAAACLLAVLLPCALFGGERQFKKISFPLRFSPPPSFTFCWTTPPSSSNSFLNALESFGRNSEQDRLLRSRGYIRSFYFHYGNFSYERDYFNVYRGFTLRQFLEGKMDLGLYKHYKNGGLLFGPAGAYLPAGSNRLELELRWNLNR